MKHVTIADFLRPAEIDRCIALYGMHGLSSTFVDAVEREITEPNIARINKALGQENNPRYLAYIVQAALARVSGERTEAAP